MAVYDTTLTNKLKFCNVYGFSREYGTKKANTQNGGSLTTMEFNENQALVYDNERPILITEDSETNNVEYNANFALTNEDIKLTLGNGGFVGVEVKVLIIKNSSVEYLSKTGSIVSDNLKAGRVVKYLWTGDYWLCSSAPAIDAHYKQYPGMEEPAFIYGGQWENISNQFAGLFDRIEGGDAETFNKQLSVSSISDTTVTFTEAHGLSTGSLIVDLETNEQRGVSSVTNDTTVVLTSAFTSLASGANVLILQNQSLPNISGSFYVFTRDNNSTGKAMKNATGAFYLTSCGGACGNGGESNLVADNNTCNLNASRSSSIYGRSSNVRTVNTTVRLWKRIS